MILLRTAQVHFAHDLHLDCLAHIATWLAEHFGITASMQRGPILAASLAEAARSNEAETTAKASTRVIIQSPLWMAWSFLASPNPAMGPDSGRFVNVRDRSAPRYSAASRP